MMSPKPARIMTSGESFKMSVSPKIVRGKLQGKTGFQVADGWGGGIGNKAVH